MKDYTQSPDAGADGIIEGRNAVAEALSGGRALYGDSLFTLALAAACFVADYVLRRQGTAA